MEPESLGPDADHAPAVEQDDCHGDDVEHGFCAQLEPLLAVPEGVYTDSLEEFSVIVMFGRGENSEAQDLPVLLFRQ